MDTIKISELDSYVTTQNNDLLAIVDSENEETKKITMQNFISSMMSSITSSLIDTIYPVGSIYISVSNTSPATLFGGTWEAFATGRTLIGVGSYTDGNGTTLDYSTVEYSSGEYLHTLSTNEMPSHFHGGLKIGENYLSAWANAGVGNTFNLESLYTNQKNEDNKFITENTGGNAGHNTCQPSITVYMWKRTA